MNLQCTLKFLKYGLPALSLEFMVLSRFIMYNRVFTRRLYANGAMSVLGLILKRRQLVLPQKS